MSSPKRIAILGATGSIGTQALEVIDASPERFAVEVLTAGRNVELLIAQARKYQPSVAVIGDEAQFEALKAGLADTAIEVAAGPAALSDAVCRPAVELVLAAVVGFAGLAPTLAAVQAGKPIALANKEALVVAGSVVMAEAKRCQVPILPVDSEHSALFQCLEGEAPESVEKLILTASGGPFRGYAAHELAEVSLAQALKHPNWDMGAKITIDSASMMNKGLEVIEAHWLFGTPLDQIEVVVHPQSIVHSLVQFRDGSLKAQLGLPDMRLPIQYALGYPDRGSNPFPRTDLVSIGQLTFEAVDTQVFRALGYAFQAMKIGGSAPCVLNAANEVAVAHLLNEQIRFTQLYDLQEWALTHIEQLATPTLEDLLQADAETRVRVAERARALV